MKRVYSYQEINLIPKYSELSSRSLADTSVLFGGKKFRLPVIPANMETVIDEKIAYMLSEKGYFYIMHRFGNTLEFIKKANKEGWNLISISVGVKDVDKELLLNVHNNGLRVDFICIDIAHVHSKLGFSALSFVRGLFKKAFIIVGNVASPRALQDLARYGADAIKVGIGGGVICSTKNETGFHYPMFSCVEDCCRHGTPYNIPIIADGGIRERGDIAKSLVAGAKLVMSGKLFASCIDSPAKIIDGKKQYYGSASYNCKKEDRHIEGVELMLNSEITYETQLRKITEALQSSISYAGGKDLSAFREVEYVVCR